MKIAACILIAVAAALPLVAQPSDDPDSVLLIVNDATRPDIGTGSMGSSQYVAEYYIQARKIPRANVFHINVPMACCYMSPWSWGSWNITWRNFDELIRKPLKKHLEETGLKDKIRYIVPTYGVPSHIEGNPVEGLSVDSFLAALYSPHADRNFSLNPYFTPATNSRPKRFKDFAPAAPFPMYLVTRLDASSPTIAASLVDRALEAERGIEKDSGTGYFDFRGVTGQYKSGDDSVKRAYDYCVEAGLKCVLNKQLDTGSMIGDAPDALWVWGWYNSGNVRDVYRFKPGAVGAQLTSSSASSVRTPRTGSYVELFLRRGATAAWGATDEPYLAGFAMGDNLLNHLWNGYNFAESAYIAAPQLGWMMVFAGDPLYRPVFRRPEPAPAACDFNLTASNRLLSSAGGTVTINVQTTQDCEWNLRLYETEGSGNGTWLNILDKVGRGNGVARVLAPPNDSRTPRAGSIQVGNRIIQYLQAGLDDSAPYQDVPADYAMAEFIRFAKSAGVLAPCESGRYCPESPLSRADMADLIIRNVLAGIDTKYWVTEAPAYADVDGNHPRFVPIQRLHQLGLAQPCATEPLRFCPDQPVTRAEFSEMLIRARIGDLYASPVDESFSDVPKAHPQYRSIQKIRDLGFTVGCDVRRYCPDQLVTRAQAAVFVSRVFLTPWEVPFR